MAPKHLQRQLDVQELNRVWEGEIPYIRIYEGRRYLGVLLGLLWRQLIGWTVSSRIDCELAMNALVMDVWHCHPENMVMVNSDQRSKFSSYDWRAYLEAHNLQ